MNTVSNIRKTIRVSFLKAIEENYTKERTRGVLREAFRILRSKPRTIGQTESAATVNAARHHAFVKRKVRAVEWISARDELVRREHIVFNNAGGRPRGHNWAEELGLGDAITIVRPHDPRAPAYLVINCRCVLIPSTSRVIS